MGAHATPADVSVIVRSMARPSLAAALDSLAAQERVEIDVVVVPAAGPGHPALPERCGRHAMRTLAPGAPMARAAAANAGLDAAGADAITFLDDDDVVAPGHVAGLLDALRAPGAGGVVHSYADAVFADGRRERVGHPFSLTELYERNYIALSSALFRRDLVADGCRFDESLDVLEDWDFFIQLAQRTPFTFVPVATLRWNAEAGTSGAAGGRNQDDARFAASRDRIYAKWSAPRDALIDRVADALSAAGAQLQQGDVSGAEARAREALHASPGDPHILNFIALVERRLGRLQAARATQECAVAARPQDPALVYNLALASAEAGDAQHAAAACRRALELSPGYAPAAALLQRLAR